MGTSEEVRILHLEDNADDAALVAHALKAGGLSFTLRWVTDRESYERELREFAPQVVLSDHRLPGLDSADALRIAARLRPGTPFILVSGALGEEGAVEVMRSGASDYVLKDRLFRLATAVDRALRAGRDRAERLRAEVALRESQERYALAVRGANDGVWDWDLKANWLYLSDRWKSMLGYAEVDLGTRPDEWLDRVHPDDATKVKSQLDQHLQGRTPHFESEHRIRHKDGSWRWVLSRGTAVWDPEGRPTRIAGSQTDVTARKEAEEALLRHAYFDLLTGLPNRTLFENRLDRALRMAQRRAYAFAVLFLDLDRFKYVNDSLGHRAGDRLLAAFARRLEELLRPGDTAARFGGDEFAILLEDIEDTVQATRIAGRVLEGLGQPFATEGHEISVSASIGVAMSSSSYDSTEALLRDADTALYRAKEMGRGRCEIFDERLRARSMEILNLERDLRRAIDRSEFTLYYQPMVSLKSGQVTGCEALLRWTHPQRGLLLPTDFIGVAEDTGLIVPLGSWVIRTACAQMKGWLDAGMGPLDLSVNVSARQCSRTDLPEIVGKALRDSGLDPSRLKLELTESCVMAADEETPRALSGLAALGVQLSMDDFGTGYSSLGNLRRFAFRALKIDRSFVRDVTTNDEDASIARAIISMGHRLKLAVTAEGIETESQRDFFRAEDCDEGQGFLFSRPVPSDRFGEVVSSLCAAGR